MILSDYLCVDDGEGWGECSGHVGDTRCHAVEVDSEDIADRFVFGC